MRSVSAAEMPEALRESEKLIQTENLILFVQKGEQGAEGAKALP